MKKYSISEEDIEKIIEKIKIDGFSEEDFRNTLTSNEIVLEFGRGDVEAQVEIAIDIDKKNNKEYFNELVNNIIDTCKRCSFDYETEEFDKTIRRMAEDEIKSQID